MVLFNYSTKELTAKVVYYGPGLCGKTTNLQWIHDKLPIKNKGKMLSLATETDRTLFFDFLPIELGAIRGMKTRIQLYTVPGQVFYNATRRMVLKGADGVVFVADSQDAMLDANEESLENLRENLEVNEISLDTVPLVLQYNKRDLPNAASVETLNQRLNKRGVPYYEAVALKGIGVEETLRGITGLVFKSLASRYGGPEGAAAASGTEIPRPNRVTIPAPAAAPPPPPRPAAAPPPPSPASPAATHHPFSPGELLEVEEEPAAEPVEELALEELGEAPEATITSPPLALDSLAPPPGTQETVEDFSPLAELEGILDAEPAPAAPRQDSATQPPDPLAELELEPESPPAPPAVAPALEPFDPGGLIEAEEAPAAFEDSAEIVMDASELLDPPPLEAGSAPAEVDAGAELEPQIDFGGPEVDPFDPMGLVGAGGGAEPEAVPVAAEDAGDELSPLDLGEAPSDDAFELEANEPPAPADADPLAGLAGAAEPPPDPPPAEAPSFPVAIPMEDAFGPEEAFGPASDAEPFGLQVDGDDVQPSAVPRPAPPPLESLSAPEEWPSSEPEGAGPAGPAWRSEPDWPAAPEPEWPGTPEPARPDAAEPAWSSAREAEWPGASEPEGEAPIPAPTAPGGAEAAEPQAEAEAESGLPASVGVGVAATASAQPAAALATPVPSAGVRTASLAVTDQGENEITIPVEIALGPSGSTQLNLNIRLTLNFKMK